MTDERVQQIKEAMSKHKYRYTARNYQEYYEGLAISFRSLYEKLIAVDFNEDQAMMILVATIQNAK